MSNTYHKGAHGLHQTGEGGEVRKDCTSPIMVLYSAVLTRKSAHTQYSMAKYAQPIHTHTEPLINRRNNNAEKIASKAANNNSSSDNNK